MRFFSTRDPELRVPLAKAVVDGLATDGGLYLPETITPFTKDELSQICSGSFQEISYHVAERLLKDSLNSATLRKLVDAAFPFEAKLVELEPGLAVHELFHGPTLAFKDFGARFLAQLLGHFAREEGREVTVLVATSGDTGSAVAAGFYRTPGVRVAILYPEGRVSPLQEKQLTTYADNIHAFKASGSFDDCQALVKKAFNDEILKNKISLTSANSINIARLVPQSFYYFSAYAALGQPERISFAVPSGNFGNLTAGVLAKRLGLPVDRLIAGTNANDTIPRYLESGAYEPMKSVQTISNAMDVGNPSNIERLDSLHERSIVGLRDTISACRFDDAQTRELMREIYETYGYLAEPHTAIAYGAAKQLGAPSLDNPAVFLATAHPIKFSEVIDDALHISVPVPSEIQDLLKRDSYAQPIAPEYEDFKAALLALPAQVG